MLLLGRQFTRFAIVGAVGTACHYIVLVLGVELAGMTPTIATTAGFCVGAWTNYQLHARFTFGVGRSTGALSRFLLTAATGALLNMLLVHLGTDVLRAHYLLVQVLATGAVLVWNFVLSRLWVFRQ